MEYDDSKQLCFPSKLVEKMQVGISGLNCLPQISLAGCHLATRKKSEACEVGGSSRLSQGKGPVQVIFFDSNKI